MAPRRKVKVADIEEPVRKSPCAPVQQIKEEEKEKSEKCEELPNVDKLNIKVRVIDILTKISTSIFPSHQKISASGVINGGDKDDDNSPNNISFLNHYLKEILKKDKHFIMELRYTPVIPSKKSVFDYMVEYTKHAKADIKLQMALLDLFHRVFERAILFGIERSQYEEIVKNTPNIKLFHLYGLPYLIRFIDKLPLFLAYKLLLVATNQDKATVIRIFNYGQGLAYYLKGMNTELTMDLYANAIIESD